VSLVGLQVFLEAVDLALHELVQRQILVQQLAVDRRQRHALQPGFAFVAEDVLELRVLQSGMPVDHAVDTITDPRAHARQPQPLTDLVLARAHLALGHVDAGHEATAQQGGQSPRVHPVVLDLGVGDDAVLGRMRQDHLRHPRSCFEQIVERAPVPAGLDHHFAGSVEPGKVGGEGARIVLVNPRLLDAAVLRVERAGHGVTFVIINSGVVHERRRARAVYTRSSSPAHVT